MSIVINIQNTTIFEPVILFKGLLQWYNKITLHVYSSFSCIYTNLNKKRLNTWFYLCCRTPHRCEVANCVFLLAGKKRLQVQSQESVHQLALEKRGEPITVPLVHPLSRNTVPILQMHSNPRTRQFLAWIFGRRLNFLELILQE